MARSETHRLRPLLRPYSSEQIDFYPVDRVVNSPSNATAACVAQIPPRRPATKPQPGQTVRVHHCPHAFRLPEGLNPGTPVKLLTWNIGTWTVDANGRQYEISMTNVSPGDEYFISGQWLHESHPLAQQELTRLAKWSPQHVVPASGDLRS